MQIGPYTLSNPWILAPMAGVSEKPFRIIARNLGAAAALTELVSAKGLFYGSSRTERFLAHDLEEKPFWVQLFGGDPKAMAEGAARAVDLGADIIDINMGCPVKKVTREGAGAALLKDPLRAAKIIQAVTNRVPVPVTAKIRAGWDVHSLNYIEFSRVLIDSGCSVITLHARTCSQGYSGKANWSFITELVAASSIPIIGNGDARTPALARQMFDQTGCAAVMIGRGALGNPWIFQALTAPEVSPQTPNDRWQLIRKHLEAHLEFVGDFKRGVRGFRIHLFWYSHGLCGANEFRRQVNKIDDPVVMQKKATEFFSTAMPVCTNNLNL
ncbi:MAG: tRNA dihydrouridine synthase DusB [Deltaproteobacteria bacterium]|nr:tRNA dihydrouridine synthase DusB [Deltaproteobacteria bacterium]